MTVIEGPVIGAGTDVTLWNNCRLRHELARIMQDRANNGQPRLKVYADKIYTTSALVTAAFSARQGLLNLFMLRMNFIMSRVRIGIEWAFGALVEKWKLLTFKRGQQLQRSPLEKHFIVGALLMNSFTCLNGGVHLAVYHMPPPTLDDYYDQPDF
jgi:hypothetical protein